MSRLQDGALHLRPDRRFDWEIRPGGAMVPTGAAA